MVAQKVKDIKKTMSEEKWNKLWEQRKKDKLFYPCSDFPDDEEETWVYMPSGRMVRRDNSSEEASKLTATSNVSKEVVKALTEEGGPMAPGALPTIKAASEEGQKKLLESLHAESDKIKKTAKPKEKANKDQTVELVPKTMKERLSPSAFRYSFSIH